MWHRFVCLLLLIAVVLCQNCFYFQGSNKFEWKIVNNTLLQGTVTFSGVANGWGAIGFKTDTISSMSGASMIMAYNPGSVNEYYASGNSLPTQNTINRFTKAYANTTANNLVLYFERPVAGDAAYAPISNSVQGLLFASAATRPVSPQVFVQHSMDHFVRINLFQQKQECSNAAKRAMSFVVFVLSIVVMHF